MAVKLRLADVALLLQCEQARQPQLSLYQQQQLLQQEQQQQQRQSAPKRGDGGGGSANNATALLAASARGGTGGSSSSDGGMSFASMPGRDSAPVIEYLYQMQELLDRPAMSVVGASTVDAAIALASAAANLEQPLSAAGASALGGAAPASGAAPAAGAAGGAGGSATAAAAGVEPSAESSAPGGPCSLAALGRALWLSFAEQIRGGGVPLDVWRAGTPSLTALAAAASASASASGAWSDAKAILAPIIAQYANHGAFFTLRLSFFGSSFSDAFSPSLKKNVKILFQCLFFTPIIPSSDIRISCHSSSSRGQGGACTGQGCHGRRPCRCHCIIRPVCARTCFALAASRALPPAAGRRAISRHRHRSHARLIAAKPARRSDAIIGPRFVDCAHRVGCSVLLGRADPARDGAVSGARAARARVRVWGDRYCGGGDGGG
jgi:hypothetical protein